MLLYSFWDQLWPTSFLQFFAVPVCSSWILKLSGTSLVCSPSIKGNMTETGPDPKALSITGLFYMKKCPGLAGSKIKSMHLSWKNYFHPERGISCFPKKKKNCLNWPLDFHQNIHKSQSSLTISWGLMNHIPLHPFAIKSHPNLISIPPKPSTIVSDISTISRCSITLSLCHLSPITSSHRHSIVIILRRQFPSLLSFVILDLFHPY